MDTTGNQQQLINWAASLEPKTADQVYLAALLTEVQTIRTILAGLEVILFQQNNASAVPPPSESAAPARRSKAKRGNL